jgi:hypothetical protein
MEPLLHNASLLSATLAGALFAAVWQGTVLALVVSLCLRLMPGLSAAARSLVWMNVFALLLLLHLLPLLGRDSRPTGFEGLGVSPFYLDPRWSLGLICTWAALSVWRASGLLLSGLHLHGLARRATPIPLEVAQRALGSAPPGTRCAVLCTSSEVDRPCVFGFLRPRILLPDGLIETLSALDLQLVLQHELEHLRRADDWTNLIQKIALVLFPLNPALLWVDRCLCAERELACDDQVLNSSGGAKAYATCLTRLAEYTMLSRGLSLVLGALDRQPELVRRVRRILARPSASMSTKAAMAASAATVLLALGAALGLSRSPQLVSFAPAVAGSTQQPASALTGFHPTNSSPAGAAPQMVKAVMPQRQHKVSTRPNLALRSTEERTVEQLPIQPQQWIVLTEWQEEQAPPPVVLTVLHRVRPSYAAVPFADGWLIVQI